MADRLTSAAVPPIDPDDHLRGSGPEAIIYLDLACPHCAAAWQQIRELPLRLCCRHFPVASKHPRAPILHHATEAAAAQRDDAFHEMWDSLLDDHGHQDDPHLWRRAEAIGLDLAQFERDRRSDAAANRVRRDFETGIRAGVTSTPAAFVEGRRMTGDLMAGLSRRAAVG